MKLFRNLLITIVIVVGILYGLVYFLGFHPAPVQAEIVISPPNAPLLKPGQKLKVMTWNVQYMAGKNNIFFYERPNNSGPDDRPSSQDIKSTLKEVARVIADEDPDVILLQEIDDGAKRTDYQDQLAELLKLLPKYYSTYTSAFYWKHKFSFNPHILGPVGMKVSTISRYKIDQAWRHQLKPMPNSFLNREIYYKRAVLETEFPLTNGKSITLFNAHLDAIFEWTPEQAEVMHNQVAHVKSLMLEKRNLKQPFLFAGDFNLLPPGQHSYLRKDQREHYLDPTEIQPLFDEFFVVPTLTDILGDNYVKFFTFLSNDPKVGGPDRTLDFIFLDDIKLLSYYVRQEDTEKISDHFPVIAEIQLPEDK